MPRPELLAAKVCTDIFADSGVGQPPVSTALIDLQLGPRYG